MFLSFGGRVDCFIIFGVEMGSVWAHYSTDVYTNLMISLTFCDWEAIYLQRPISLSVPFKGQNNISNVIKKGKKMKWYHLAKINWNLEDLCSQINSLGDAIIHIWFLLKGPS